MSKIQELLVSAVMPAIKSVGKFEIEQLLLAVKNNNTPEVYAHVLQSVYSAFVLLRDVANRTDTKIDNGIVELVLEAVDESAAAAGITLLLP